MKRRIFLGGLLACGWPIMAVASNHDQHFYTTLEDRHYTGVYDKTKPFRENFTLTYVADVELYADETETGDFTSKHKQCTWALNATLRRRTSLRHGRFTADDDFKWNRDPIHGVNTANSSCSSLENSQEITNEVNQKLDKAFWIPEILGYEFNESQFYDLKPATTSVAGPLRQLESLAMACHEAPRSICRYQIASAIAKTWLIAPNSPPLGVDIPLTPAEQQALHSYISRLDEAASVSSTVDDIADKVMGILKDKAVEALGWSPTIAPIVEIVGGIIFGDAPNGLINEAMQIEYGRMTDDDLDAEEARANQVISSLTEASDATPNNTMKRALRMAVGYFSACKKAVVAERSIRNAIVAGRGVNGTDHSNPATGSLQIGSPGRGAESGSPGAMLGHDPGGDSDHTTEGGMGHDFGASSGQPGSLGATFGGILGGRPHGHGSGDDDGSGEQGPIGVPGPP